MREPWCSCYEENDIQYPCETHSTLLRLRGFSHQGYCEECCDVPLYQQEIRDLGEDVVRRAVSLMPDREREYGERILELSLAERNEAGE